MGFMGEQMREGARHWEDSDLLLKLYGLAPEGGASEEHLVSCEECSRRWAALRSARIETLGEVGAGLVPETRLLAQRRAIWARIEHPRRSWLLKWAPVAATATMLVAGLVLLHPVRPVPAPASQQAESSVAPISDAELFSDLADMASASAPRAADPIRGLFQNSDFEDGKGYYQ